MSATVLRFLKAGSPESLNEAVASLSFRIEIKAVGKNGKDRYKC